MAVVVVVLVDYRIHSIDVDTVVSLDSVMAVMSSLGVEPLIWLLHLDV